MQGDFWVGWLFPRVRGFGENVRHLKPRLRFFKILFFKWRLARAHLFHSLGQDQSTVAQRAETTVTDCSHDDLRVSSIPDRFPHSAWTAA